jgi:Rrf2 family protein
MAVNTQFSIAVHVMAALACQPDADVTSGDLAASVNTSPSFVRRVLSKLSKAGLIKTTTGKSGACRFTRKAADISLADIYHAVDAPAAFSIHSYPEQKCCTVSCHIKAALEKALARTQKDMEASLAGISLARIISDVRKK